MIDEKLANELRERAQKGDASVMRSPELRALFDELKTRPAEERAGFGQAINALRQELTGLLSKIQDEKQALPPIDITAPFDTNTLRTKGRNFCRASRAVGTR